MKFNFFDLIFLSFFGIIFISRIPCQNEDNKRFERNSIKDQVSDTFYFIDFLDPLFLLSLPFPFGIYYFFGIKALLVLWIIFSFAQLLVWAIAMKRYSDRPTELKKRRWQNKYLFWIIGHLLSLVAGICLLIKFMDK